MSNKFHSSDTVRVIKSCGHFDSVGQIFEVGYRGGKPRYHVYFDDLLARWFYDDDLTLADPDVHTVLDEMDAESALSKSVGMDEREIDGYVPGREVRSVSMTGAEKGTKPERFDLLPAEALAKVAHHYAVGAEKYADHNWRKGYEWSKSYAALQRHANLFWAGQDNDEETGTPHMAAVAFHALSLLTFMDEQPGFDDRYRAEAAQ